MHKNDRKLRKVTALFKYTSFYKLDSAILETVLAHLVAPSVIVQDIVVSNFSLSTSYMHKNDRKLRKVTALFKYTSFYKLDSAILETVLAHLVAPSVIVQDIVVSNFSLSTSYMHKNDRKLRKVTALFKYTSFYKLDSAILETVLAHLVAPSVIVQDIVVSNFSLSTSYMHKNDRKLRKVTALFKYTSFYKLDSAILETVLAHLVAPSDIVQDIVVSNFSLILLMNRLAICIRTTENSGKSLPCLSILHSTSWIQQC